jgi:hypothetical protein
MNYFFSLQNEKVDLFSFKWHIKFRHISFNLLYFVYGADLGMVFKPSFKCLKNE